MPDNAVLEQLNASLNALSLPPAKSLSHLGASFAAQHYQATLKDSERLFIKYYETPSEAVTQAEAHGLKALRTFHGHTPAVVLQTDHLLATQWVDAGNSHARHFEQLAQNLASQHSVEADTFGFDINTYCGDTQQNNTPNPDGFTFFAEQRLLALAAPAFDQGSLARQHLKTLERLCAQLPELIPPQKPVLLHGDLWAGNFLASSAGHAVLIDPACYWGWAEADLAMTLLFGGFEPSFYRQYQEAAKPEPGWQQRASIYNLYHLLNHTLLFGEAYALQLEQSLKQLQ